jgi:glutamate synthase (NADPH/NADH) small chain
MTEKLLKFTHVDPRPPTKRPAAERRGDFKEIHRAFSPDEAKTQASRCSQCGVPFCQTGCPLQNNIPDWLQLEAEGRLREAYLASSATNPMPEICGRICPQDRLCEGVCVIEQSTHGAVTIGAIEKHITETAWAEGWVEPIPVGPDRGLSVAIVGAGPAGLAAAERLRRLGYGATVYDRHDRAGGLLTYGIPDFKLEKHVVARRVERLEQAGVVFKLGVDVGRDVSFDELKNTHAAVLIAIGVYKARELKAPGAGAPGVFKALDYLFTANRVSAGREDPRFASGELDAKGKRVIVIGGGDTAMDCVRTAVRQGATSVTCLYRRDKANMPGSAREVKSAEEEGVVFEWLAQPKAVLQGKGGEASGVRSVRMRLGPPDASGRQAPEETPGSDFDLPADMVVMALGFEPEDAPKMFGLSDLAVTRGGSVVVDIFGRRPSLDDGAGMTRVDGVFAAGDIVRGASLVVRAIKDGLDAADQIHARITAKAAAAARTAAE